MYVNQSEKYDLDKILPFAVLAIAELEAESRDIAVIIVVELGWVAV